MARLEIRTLNKIYQNGNHIIKDVTLNIDDGQFTVFVGPSGCGKSTLLRMIAGLEDITSGTLTIDGIEANRLSPKERGIGMVFQSYALYPHMTIFENMAFGLKLSKMKRKEIENAVNQVAEILELTSLLKRKPAQLSGGQRQRVAIGRAIVRNPRVFLLDEPLSNLDASLRVRMRLQLAKYHQKLRSTVIYVTHDQVEAMTLADRIVVLKQGAIEQVGSPMELYHFPNTLFVAGFIGSPKMNFLPVTLGDSSSEGIRINLNGTSFYANVDVKGTSNGALLTLGIRPEDIQLSVKGIGVQIEGIERLGTESLLYTTLLSGGQSIVVRVPGTVLVEIGQHINITIPVNACHLFDSNGMAFRRGIELKDLLTPPPHLSVNEN